MSATKHGLFIRIDDEMTWPCADSDTEDFLWKLKYSGQELSDSDRLVAASYISAYIALIYKNREDRNYIVKMLREVK